MAPDPSAESFSDQTEGTPVNEVLATEDSEAVDAAGLPNSFGDQDASTQGGNYSQNTYGDQGGDAYQGQGSYDGGTDEEGQEDLGNGETGDGYQQVVHLVG